MKEGRSSTDVRFWPESGVFDRPGSGGESALAGAGCAEGGPTSPPAEPETPAESKTQAEPETPAERAAGAPQAARARA